MAGTKARTQGTAPAPDTVLLGRYRLVDRVANSSGTSFWRATDERLRRPVGVRLMPLRDPLVGRLRDAATAASQVSDRRSVPVLDVVEDRTTKQLVIVCEWVTGTPFGDLVAARGGEPMPPREAAAIALEVARFLAAAEESGLAHGRIRPNTVMVTDTGEVRVRGLGVDRVLGGVEPDIEPSLADVHGAGAVLYAGLTGRWPGPVVHDRLTSVPLLAQGRPPWPSRVVADVPADLDEIAARALQTTHQPKGGSQFTSVSEVIAALGAALTVAPVERRRPRRTLVRTGSVVLFTAATVGLAGLGVSMIAGLGAAPLTTPVTAPQTLPTTAPTTAPTTSTTGSERDLPIVSAVDFDPYGDTKQENPQEAPLAIDDNPGTAWHTVRYKNSTLSGKPGVGLIVDLGADRPVRAVALNLVGLGTDLSILASDDPTAPPEKWTPMGMDATAASDSVLLRIPRPVTTRYLLVWITQVPSVDGSYQGGIAEIHVRG